MSIERMLERGIYRWSARTRPGLKLERERDEHYGATVNTSKGMKSWNLRNSGGHLRLDQSSGGSLDLSAVLGVLRFSILFENAPRRVLKLC